MTVLVSRRYVLWTSLTLLFCLAAVAYVQLPAFQDPYRVNNDLRHYFWMSRFRDPTLFPGDPLISEVKGVRTSTLLGVDLLSQPESLGFGLVYQLASGLFTPLAFSRLLPFILVTVCAVYLFAFGVSQGLDPVAAAAMTVVVVSYNLTASDNISLVTGLERSFQFVLLIAFMCYLVNESPAGLVITLVLQVLFYPPMFAVSAMTYGLSLLVKENGRVGIDWRVRRILPLIIGTTLAMLVLLPALLDPQIVAESLSEHDGKTPVWRNPTYGPMGRIPIFPERSSGFPFFLVAGYGGLMRIDDLYLAMPLCLWALMVLALLGFRRSALGWRVNALVLGSMVAWLTCWLVALATGYFALRYPFKYTNAALPLWLLLYCSLNGSTFVSECARIWHSPQDRWRLVIAVLGAFVLFGGLLITDLTLSVLVRAVGALAFVVGVGSLLLWRRRLESQPNPQFSVEYLRRAWGVYLTILLVAFVPRMQSRTIDVTAAERVVLAYASETPTNTLFAGDPAVMSDVALFSERSVLFSDEISYVGWTTVMDFYEAYYAESSADVLGFCRKYDVDYIVVDTRHFESAYLEEGRFFYSPYNESIIEIVASRNNLALTRLPDARKSVVSSPWFVFGCSAGGAW